MLLIHRSILKELLASFVLSIIFLNFTLIMEKLLKLSRLFSDAGVPVTDMAKIILYLQPQIFIFTIPMSLLLSTLLTYGRMDADNELTILKGSGMSFKGISAPVAYTGLVCFIISMAMSFYIGPKGSIMLREKVTEILTKRAPMTIEEGIFNTAFKDIIIMIKEKKSPDTLSGIFIVDERKKGEEKIITAQEGRIITENDTLSFSLVNGSIYIMQKNAHTEISFGKYHFRLNPSTEPSAKKNNELTPAELLSASRESGRKQTSYLLEFYRRLSLPAICLILILLGPSLALIAGKSGKLGGLTIGLSVFAAYYSLLIYGENLARSGKIPVFIGAWLSFAILGAFSLMVFQRANKR